MKKQFGEITVGLVSVLMVAVTGLLASGTVNIKQNYDPSCEAKTVKSETGNYSYTSYEHCQK